MNGSWVVRRLLEAGHHPIAFDNRNDSVLISDIVAEVPVVTGDIRDEHHLLTVFRQNHVDGVIHLAAVMNEDPRSLIQINCQGTLAVLEAASAVGVRRVVFASSSAVYAPFSGRYGHPEYVPISEEYPRQPAASVKLYGTSKIFGEELGAHFHDIHGLEFLALRFSYILAPGRMLRIRQRGKDARTNRPETIIEAALAGDPAIIQSGGDQKADILYVKDLAASVVCAVSANGDASGAYNIGTGTLSSLHDVAGAVLEVLPDASISVGKGLDFLGLGPIYALFDISKARAHIGYSPRFDLRRAVADYVDMTRALHLMQN